MLKGFCRKGYPLSLPDSTASIEKYIERRGREILDDGGRIFFVCDSHELTDPEINKPYPPHCLSGTVEAEIIDELQELAKNSTILHKNTLSIFLNTELEKLIKEVNPELIEITGVCTDICVLFAAYELRMRGYNIQVSRDGVLPLASEKQDEFLEYFSKRLAVDIIS